MKIMVVDDEKDVELLFMQHFRKEVRAGVVEFVFAFSGDEALLKLDGMVQPPDFLWIFSDIQMPGISGLELLRAVKARYPRILVSMITAYSDQYYTEAMAAGADRYFTKPLDFSYLKKELLKL